MDDDGDDSLTTSSTCWRCGNKNRETRGGAYRLHSERECFEALTGRVKRLEAQIAIMIRYVAGNAAEMVADPRCKKCERSPEQHPGWDCKEFAL